jgi:hypothetical protein
LTDIDAAKKLQGIHNLGLAAATLTASLTYLNVPFGNALLIGVVVTLQAAFGFLVLSRIIPNVHNSFLFLLGPGVIVGGAMSFFLFQIVGRGWIGLIATTTTGLTSALVLARSTQRQTWKNESPWLISQILGLAALGLTWEFGELLPAAITLFILGFITSGLPQFSLMVRWLTGVGAIGLVVAAFFLRQNYWWLVTDDYQFFEVMSKHITSSGPLADWGASNWSRYHWLSYGWSGLLNLSGGSPESFVTLTRVMPGLYSLSLGASLILIASFFELDSKKRFLTTLPAWTIIALHRLDWSGTSTSGVYAVLVALAATIVLEISTTNSLKRRMFIYAIGVPVITLTKLPSLYAVFVFVTLIEIWNNHSSIYRFRRSALLAVAPIGVALLAVALIGLGSNTVGGWKFVTVNPNLGQLSEFGSLFAGMGLLLQKLWILAPVLVGVLWSYPRSLHSSKNLTEGLAYCAIPLFLLGLFLDIKIFGNANTAEYFSGPMYFLSSLILLPLIPSTFSSRDRIPFSTTIFSSLTFLFFGITWSSFNLGIRVLDFIGVQLLQWNSPSDSMLRWISGDGRFAIALTFLLVNSIGFWHARWRPVALIPSLIALTVYSLGGYVDHSRTEFARERSVNELAQNIGSPDIQSVGFWLNQNSMPGDLVATNHIAYPNGKPLSSFDLAVWSERTFLVLGPRFGGESPAKDRAVALSLRFAENPSEEICNSLSEFGVRWFVIDLRLTQTRSWSTCTTTAYENKDFLVLQLTS